ncbi:FapA family protein [Bacillaceae bacterium IKA-2]|nr:FapA family protein [Bacillaceae bacterium IKA-2]
MIALDDFLEIHVDKGKMKATMTAKKHFDDETTITVEDIKSFIGEHGIVFGIKEELLTKILTDEKLLPQVIAEGIQPINGDHAVLKPIFPEIEEIENKEDLRKVDLKQVINIPSVTCGQLIGKKIPVTSGKTGMNIMGEELAQKPGKDFRLRAGKNTRVEAENLKLYATVDGQISVESKVIHVYPTFDVNGDLDLKVGNISFVGTVNIRGNVPAGFEIKSKGDIKIHGTVESAVLISEGSIFVSAGIVGQGKGLIKAKGDLHTAFINQGIVEVEGDVNVTQSILQSKIQAGGSVYCHKGKGNIVGGDISAGKDIFVKDVGNSHFTKTALFLGVHQDIMKKEKNYCDNLKKAEDELKKLTVLFNFLDEKEKNNTLTTKEKIMKLRVRNTLSITTETMEEAKEKLEDFKDIYSEFDNSTLTVEKQIYSNVDVHFGKYRRKIISAHHNVKIFLENKEIIIGPL